MILSAQSIRKRRPVEPFHERTVSHGKTFGLSAAGYDVRIREAVILRPGDFALASTLERFTMPDDLLARVADKSSWARKGLTVQNTVIEPGWFGFLTSNWRTTGRTVWKFRRVRPSRRSFSNCSTSRPSSHTPANIKTRCPSPSQQSRRRRHDARATRLRPRVWAAGNASSRAIA
jgi:hypothetical protein